MNRRYRSPISFLLGLLLAGTGTVVAAAGLQEAVPISIVLRPDDPPPTIIAPQAAGRLPVGILTTAEFDATTLSPATLRLGPTGTEAAPLRVARMDLDSDGDVDLQVFFGIADMGVRCEDRVVMLKGRTMDGQEVEGSDAIVTEEC